MPNKTIYVSDSDLQIYQRAQELAGDNLSAAIATALRRYVDVEDSRKDGFDEVVVRVGPGAGRKVRFVGILLGEWADSSWDHYDTTRVYRGRSGKYVVHAERTPTWRATDSQGKPAGWKGWIGLGDVNYTVDPGGATLEVVDTLEQLKDKVPPQLYELVAKSADQPTVEDLDI